MSYIFKKIALVLGIVLLLGALYFGYTRINQQGNLVMEEERRIELEKKSEKILLDTQRIKSLKFDSVFFSDKRFSSLKDTRQDLIETESGRINPFESL